MDEIRDELRRIELTYSLAIMALVNRLDKTDLLDRRGLSNDLEDLARRLPPNGVGSRLEVLAQLLDGIEDEGEE